MLASISSLRGSLSKISSKQLIMSSSLTGASFFELLIFELPIRSDMFEIYETYYCDSMTPEDF
jgi:hypothetical protein